MSFLAVFPSVETRLTRSQHELMAPGFRQIAERYACYVANGVKPVFYIFPVSPRPTSITGRYNQALIEAFLDLGNRLASLFSVPCGSRRVRLTAVEIEFLMFAARLTRKQVEHGHIERPASYSKMKIKHLLGWLEARRKRAKRCWLFSPAARNAYPQVQARWAKLMPWIHCCLLYCTCHRMPPTDIRRRQRLYIERLMSFGREVLKKKSLALPDDCELRRLSRAFLHTVRRGYHHTTLWLLLRSNTWTKERLADYLIPRVQNSLKSVEPYGRERTVRTELVPFVIEIGRPPKGKENCRCSYH